MYLTKAAGCAANLNLGSQQRQEEETCADIQRRLKCSQGKAHKTNLAYRAVPAPDEHPLYQIRSDNSSPTGSKALQSPADDPQQCG